MRTLVLSDIHANLEALQCILNQEKNNYDLLISLGDIVGYGPYPNECVEIIASEAAVSLAGNHDLGVCGKIDTEVFSHTAKKSLEWTRSVITDQNMHYLDSLESSIIEYRGVLLSHGSPESPVWGYIFSQADAGFAFTSADFTLSFFGHTHVPSVFSRTPSTGDQAGLTSAGAGEDKMVLETREPGLRMMINPGSAGFPRDKKNRLNQDYSRSGTQYGLFDFDTRVWQFRELRYDMNKTIEIMSSHGLW